MDTPMDVTCLSPATSQAWLRLEEEGVLSLIAQSDAGRPVLLDDAGERRQIAEVRFARQARRGARRAPRARGGDEVTA
jgi:hypothetical protein